MRNRLPSAERKMQVIDMKMNDVELTRVLENTLQHDEMVGHLALVTFIQTQRPPARRHQPRIRLRISARKERHFVALSHQFFGGIRHHAFRSSIILRRHAFIKPRHLCNSHPQTIPSSLQFTDPAQPGQIMPAESRGSYRCASILATDFARLFMFEYVKENARTHFFFLSDAPNYQLAGASRTTSPGFLSSRNPMKTGARNFPSRVHSANLISATNFGVIQRIFFIIECVIPSTHWPFCFAGRSTNGQSARSSARNFLWNAANDFVVNPVPTLPANTRSRSL